ncbi:MAG TPA: hypothetical protein VGE07_23235 [Herpetosiphonaceae bacterium]
MSKLLLAMIVVLAGGALLRDWKTRHWRWIGLNAALVAAAVMGWTLAPGWAGYAVAAASALLIGLPQLSARRMAAMEARGDDAGRQRWFSLGAWIATPEQRRAAAAMGAATKAIGERRLDEALARLEPHKNSDWGRCMTLYLKGEWAELRDFCATMLRVHRDEPFYLTSYLRALAELGQFERMLREADARWERLDGLPDQQRQQVLLMIFAFAGEPELVQRIGHARLAETDPVAYAFWLATACYAAGNPLGAEERLRAIADDGDALWQARIERRISQPPPARPQLSPASQELLARFRERWMRVPALG